MSNKLLCSFVMLDNVDNFIQHLQQNYTLLYSKIFVLSTNEEEHVCTYSLDLGNTNYLPDDTIIVHRKKDYNTLYSLNALNTLIKNLNSGVLDASYIIEWEQYKNSILLTRDNTLHILPTKIHKIFSF